MDQEGTLAAVATHHPSWLSHSKAAVGQGSRHDTVKNKAIWLAENLQSQNGFSNKTLKILMHKYI